MRVDCHYCGREVFKRGTPGAHRSVIRTADHMKPRTLFKALLSNKVVACFQCNGIKGSTPYEVFTAYIEQHGAEDLHRNPGAYKRHCYDLTLKGFAQKED